MIPILIMRREINSIEQPEMLSDEQWHVITNFIACNHKYKGLQIMEREFPEANGYMHLVMVATEECARYLEDIDWDEVPLEKLIIGPDGTAPEITWHEPDEEIYFNHPAIDEDQLQTLSAWLELVGVEPKEEKTYERVIPGETYTYDIQHPEFMTNYKNMKYIGKFPLPSMEEDGPVHVFVNQKNEKDPKLAWLHDDELTTRWIQVAEGY
jgi:hypothetical protein